MALAALTEEAAVNLSATVEEEPTSYEEAINSPEGVEWRRAMEEEMSSLHVNGTWTLEKPPHGTKLLPVKWVYKKKRGADGQVLRYKGRLVVKGFAQRKGIDYNEVFAPVAKYSTMRALLAKAAAEGLHLHQLDVKTAFLNGDLEEDIWMQQPPGFSGGEGLACHLKKSLYGLKQAPRAWNSCLLKELEALGYRAVDADACLFVKETEKDTVWLLVYVDDILLAAKHLATIVAEKAALAGVFDIHDMGKVCRHLGMDITRDLEAGTLTLSQKRMAVEVVAKYGLSDANGRVLPLQTSTKLEPAKPGEPLLDTSKYAYAEAIGSLMYLVVCTRPDLAQAVGALARHVNKPTWQHWLCLKGVLRYLAGTLDLGITYSKSKPVLEAYCDADYAGDVDSRKSTSGFVFLMHGGAMSWGSHLQTVVAASTTEAEFIAAASATKEALWLHSLLKALGRPVATIDIKCDNQGAIKVMKHPIASKRTKHIDVAYKFACFYVRRGDVAFQYCATAVMVADIMTKPLPQAKFEFCRSNMGMRHI